MRTPRRRQRTRVGIILLSLFVGIALVFVGYWLWLSPSPSPAPDLAPGKITSTPKQDDAYRVFSDRPVHIQIGAADVDATIIALGKTADGAMAAPDTLTDVGWYERSARVGEDSTRSVLLDGHYGTDATPGVFYKLGKIKKGDEISLTGASGAIAVYTVVAMEQKLLEDVDMKKAYAVYPEERQSLTLITCEGDYDVARATYDKRSVVYAVRIR